MDPEKIGLVLLALVVLGAIIFAVWKVEDKPKPKTKPKASVKVGGVENIPSTRNAPQCGKVSCPEETSCSIPVSGKGFGAMPSINYKNGGCGCSN